MYVFLLWCNYQKWKRDADGKYASCDGRLRFDCPPGNDCCKAVSPTARTRQRILQGFAGVRFANISEPRRGLVLNEAQIKSMTGNDTLNARFLHENSFDFKPQFKLYVNTNYLPAITDMTLFSSGRIVIIPFDRHFEEWEQEQNLKAEFSILEVASAILNWLIEGYTLYKRKDLPSQKQ